MVTGSSLWVIGEYVTGWQTPYLIALLGATLIYLLVAGIELYRKKQITA